MSVSGLCQICQSRPATDRCENCGTFACRAHYERGPGLCADCLTQVDPSRETDVDVHRF